MSDLTRDEVARLAVLARLDLTDDELDRLAKELEVIVDSVANVSTVPLADVPYTSHPVPMTNVLRDDVPEASVDLVAVLAVAPEVEGRMFVVPQILGEE